MSIIKFNRVLQAPRPAVTIGGGDWRLSTVSPVWRNRIPQGSLSERRSDYLRKVRERLDKEHKKQG